MAELYLLKRGKYEYQIKTRRMGNLEVVGDIIKDRVLDKWRLQIWGPVYTPEIYEWAAAQLRMVQNKGVKNATE